MRHKKKYSHIAKDGFSDLMRSYANRRTHVVLCLRLEKELYRLWNDVEGKKVETKPEDDSASTNRRGAKQNFNSN